MNIGKLLGAISPGLSAATGLFGGGAQGGILGAASPLMALLLHHKNGGAAPTGDAAAPGATPVAPAPGPSPLIPPQPLAQATGPDLNQVVSKIPQIQNPGMDPAKRQRIAQMLLSFGGSMGGFGQPRY